MNTSGIVTKLFGIALAVMLSACAYPTSSVEQGGKETALYFSHAPLEAHVFIDGMDAGLAAPFDGKEAVLAVASGRHLVKVRVGSSVVYEQDIYLGDGVVLKIDLNQMGKK